MPQYFAGRSWARVKPASGIRPPRPTWARRWFLLVVVGLAAVFAASFLTWAGDSGKRLRRSAEAAASAGDWNTALKWYPALNATTAASGPTYLGEARACLALGRASQSERALLQSISADPGSLEPWQLLLQILRVEDRTIDAVQRGWQAYRSVPLAARRAVLRELTFSLLAELPDDVARNTLHRWVDADENDIDARVALIQRIAIQPRAADPDRAAWLADLDSIVAAHPEHITAREVLVMALADAGEPARGRALLDDWPMTARDARYWRLAGRWALEYDNRPEQAATAFRTALEELPQDWRTWYRLARALRALGRDEESRAAAETVRRIREALDPLFLGPRLDAAFGEQTKPTSLEDLAGICKHVGLTRLGEAWHDEAQH